MGRYIEEADINLTTKIIAHLSGGSGGVPDDDVVNQVISKAEDKFDGYVSAKYDVPLRLQYITGTVKDLCSTLAIHILYLRSQDAKPEDHKDDYGKAIEQLKEINNGEIKLGASTVHEDTAHKSKAVLYERA
jgi:phage gp36-like protein